MKNLIKIMLIIITASALHSCDDSFSPKGEFEEGYTLYCVIDGDTTKQEAYLFRNYNPVGFDALSYNENRTVQSARIKISDGDKDYIFEDTSEFKESLGYTVNYYKLNNFKPSNYQGKQLSITAVTPDGDVLSGSTLVDIKSVHFLATTRKELPYDPIDSLVVLFGNNSFFQFSPFLKLNCRKIENGDTTYFEKEVPERYVNIAGEKTPLYPEYKLRNEYRYSIANIIAVINELVKDKKPANKIKIVNLTLGVLQVTNPLDIYYKTIRTSSDGFSIKTQAPNITNIENANGIFAYKATYSVDLLFRRDWNNYFAEKDLEQRQ